MFNSGKRQLEKEKQTTSKKIEGTKVRIEKFEESAKENKIEIAKKQRLLAGKKSKYTALYDRYVMADDAAASLLENELLLLKNSIDSDERRLELDFLHQRHIEEMLHAENLELTKLLNDMNTLNTKLSDTTDAERVVEIYKGAGKQVGKMKEGIERMGVAKTLFDENEAPKDTELAKIRRERDLARNAMAGGKVDGGIERSKDGNKTFTE
jgi:acyl transferase domain-containing protein